jgi:integrase
MRSGEVRGLRWKHRVEPNWLHLEETKGGYVREVPLPYRAQVMLGWWEGASRFTEPGDMIFPGRCRYKPMNRSALAHHFNRCVPKVVEIGNRYLTAHSFRHTYNTMMRQVLPEDTLRELIGHKSEKMTDLYDHPTIQDRIARLRPAVKLIENFLK